MPAQAADGWKPAVFANEGKRTVQGCASVFTDDAYVCLFVRCDAPGSLGLYVTAPGPDVTGRVRLAIEERTFPVTFLHTPSSPLPLSNRAETIPDGLLAAMKSGREIRILDANLTAGYDVIPLKGAAPALGRIEKVCAAS